ncbi:MAG: ABC transporter substrate-binding protein, partial [Desulfurococcaceae archaeon]
MKYSNLMVGIILVAILLTPLVILAPTASAQAPPRILERTIIYTLPYIINFNPWAPGNTFGLAWLCGQPLFYFLPNNQLYIPALGKRATFNAEEFYIEVELWKDNYWNNQGQLVRPLNARDVWAMYTIQWKIMRSYIPYLLDIVIVDDYTIRFYLNKTLFRYDVESPYIDDPSKVDIYNLTTTFRYYALYGILGWWLHIQVPYELFGPFAEKVANIPADKVPEVFDLEDLQNEVREFAVDVPWCIGPYWLDRATLTPHGVVLRKNEGWRYKDKLPWDEIRYTFVGAEEALVQAIIAGKELIGMPGFALEILAMIQEEAEDIKIIYAWNFEIHGFVFNIAKYPYNVTEVRHALALLVDKEESAGAFPPLYVPYYDYPLPISSSRFLPDWIKANLRNWTRNPTEAYRLLEKAGFRRGPDGYWRMPTGEIFKVRILATVGYGVPWQATGLNIVSQLEQHGIQGEVEVVDLTVYWSRVGIGDYDVLITWSGSGYESLCMMPDGLWGMLYGVAGKDEAKLKWTWPVPLPNGTVIYVCPDCEAWRVNSAIPGSQEYWDAVAKVVWWYNYYLPSFTLWGVRRAFYFNIREVNIFDYLGAPDDWIEIAGTRFPYYERDAGLMITWVYPMNYWIALGMIKRPEQPVWPPTGPRRYTWDLLPPGVKEGAFDIIEFFAKGFGVVIEAPEIIPVPTPTPTPEITP